MGFNSGFKGLSGPFEYFCYRNSMRNNFKHITNQPVDRYYSPKFSYYWRLLLESPQSFSHQRTTDLPFEDQFGYWVHILGPGFASEKKSTIFPFFVAPPPLSQPNIIPKPVPVSLYLLWFVDRIVLRTSHKQVSSFASIAHQLFAGTASDCCTICCVLLLLQVLPPTKKYNTRLT